MVVTEQARLTADLECWLGKEPVHETRHATKQLLSNWAALLGVPFAEPDSPVDDERAFIGWACKVGCELETITVKELRNWEDGVKGVFVGFPDTPIGRLNAQLVGAVHRVLRFRNRTTGVF